MEGLPKLRSLAAGRFRRLKYQLKLALNNPYIGVTQGGSSREWPGARVAATKAEVKPPKLGVKNGT